MAGSKFQVLMPEPFSPLAWAREALEGHAELHLGSLERPFSEEELAERVKGIEGILASARDPITRAVLEAGEKLKIVSMIGRGVDNIDLRAATEKGVLVTNTPGANAESVAELVVGLLLSLLRRLPPAISKLKEGVWRGGHLLGHELKGSTVGIIGFGHVGSRVSLKLRGFEVRVLTYDPYIPPVKAERCGARWVADLDELLRESDILSLNPVLTEETYHMIGEREFRLMKPGSFLINTSRGRVVDEGALLRALKEGQLGGAALDVFTVEPATPDNPLFALENVFCTPHMGSQTYAAKRRLLDVAVENLLRTLRGSQPTFSNIANPEVLEPRREPKGAHRSIGEVAADD